MGQWIFLPFFFRMRVSCSLCDYDIDKKLGGFTLCLVCNESYLCTKCSISQDVVVCKLCTEGHEFISKRTSRVCPSCDIAWRVDYNCEACTTFFCLTCFESHECFKCKEPGCDSVGIYERCCGVKRCEKCHSKHRTTNCRTTMFYKCRNCGMYVYTFGPNHLRCPVERCTSRYGCFSTACNGVLSRFNKKGIYCRNHTSENNCPGCKMAYPLDPALGVGYVRILILLGIPVKRREHCGDCMGRIRALVESVLIITKRLGGFPKVLMDMIVFNALNVLQCDKLLP